MQRYLRILKRNIIKCNNKRNANLIDNSDNENEKIKEDLMIAQ